MVKRINPFAVLFNSPLTKMATAIFVDKNGRCHFKQGHISQNILYRNAHYQHNLDVEYYHCILKQEDGKEEVYRNLKEFVKYVTKLWKQNDTLYVNVKVLIKNVNSFIEKQGSSMLIVIMTFLCLFVNTTKKNCQNLYL